MKIAILGYDTEGKVSYDYFAAQGHYVTICDKNTDVQIPEGAKSILGDAYLDDLDRFDLLVRTAGMPPRVILEKNPDVENKITTHINEFFKACPTKNIIGVTGTKGKGTTSSLITKMLEVSGRDVYLGGNIGLPPITFLNKLTKDSWVVLELSSFQLSDLKYSPHIGLCLMVVPEHLNWHTDLDDYYHAKSNLFAHQQPEDIAVYFADSDISWQITQTGQAQKIPFYVSPGAYIENETVKINNQNICGTAELQLIGTHNWQNACAAATVFWQIDKNIDPIKKVLTSFTGLPHRLEMVRDIGSVKYFNDSFASTPDASIAAMNAIGESKILIVGGFDRGLPIDHLSKSILDNSSSLRKVLIIGQSAARLAEELNKVGFSNYEVTTSKDIEAIVNHARDLVQPGDAVVFSPGFASFDMFKNFEDRGEKFKAAVEKL